MARATLLLPAAARFGGQRLSAPVAASLGRGHRTSAAPGRQAQLRRHVDVPADAWPIAALSRQADCGDAGDAQWLRADPAFLRPDINGVRLLAIGEDLHLSEADRDALLPALKPLFGDAGFELDAPHTSRWYLRLPRDTPLPAFPDPDEALGEDLFEHHDDAPHARRWRALANEAQIVLHNHPWNARRRRDGLQPVNALWLWGAGALPDGGLHSLHGTICSDDPTLRALTAASTVQAPLPARYPGGSGDTAFDLVAARDLRLVEGDWLLPALDALRRGKIDALELDFADGRVVELMRWQRWRWWKRPLSLADAGP